MYYNLNLHFLICVGWWINNIATWYLYLIYSGSSYCLIPTTDIMSCILTQGLVAKPCSKDGFYSTFTRWLILYDSNQEYQEGLFSQHWTWPYDETLTSTPYCDHSFQSSSQTLTAVLNQMNSMCNVAIHHGVHWNTLLVSFSSLSLALFLAYIFFSPCLTLTIAMSSPPTIW